MRPFSIRDLLAESSTPSATCWAPAVRAALLAVRVSRPSTSWPRPLSSWFAPSKSWTEPLASRPAPSTSWAAPESSCCMASFSWVMPAVRALTSPKSKTLPCPSASALAADAIKICGVVRFSTSASTVTVSCK